MAGPARRKPRISINKRDIRGPSVAFADATAVADMVVVRLPVLIFVAHLIRL